MCSETKARKKKYDILERRKKLGMRMDQQVSQHFLNENVSIANQNWWNLTKENSSIDKNKKDGKDRYTNEDNNLMKMQSKTKAKAKTKRTFENNAIRCVRSGHFPCMSSSATQPLTYISRKKSSSIQEKKTTRNIRSNYGSYRHLSQASKRRDEGNKNDQKESVIGSFATTLGPDDGTIGCNLPFESNDDVQITWETKVKETADAVVAVPFESRKWQTPMIFSVVHQSRNGPRKRDRNERIVGARVTMLGLEDGSLVRSDHFKNSLAGSNPTNAIATGIENKGNFNNNRNRPTTFQNSCVSKRRDDDTNDRKLNVKGSLFSILGPENESLVPSVQNVHLTSRTKSPESRTCVSSFHEKSPINRKRPTINRDVVVSSMRQNSRKEAQRIINHKCKNGQKTKKSHFNEDEARRLIQARLQKNQQKYAALASALTRAKSSEPVTPLVLSTTTSPESIRTEVATSQPKIVDSGDDVNTTNVSLQPKLRSRARNGRLYSVCKRIPPSIPEHMVFLLEIPSSASLKSHIPSLV